MKKYLFILLLLFAFSCEQYKQVGETEDSTPVSKFSFQGHDYLQFGNLDSRWGTHDPDCKNFKCVLGRK